MSIFRKKP